MSISTEPAPSSLITVATEVPPPGGGRMRAAEYVRMSTDHQQYSVANQQDAIRRYAQAHNFQVVRTYADEGISGLMIRNRDGLSELLSDVLTRRADFEAILVYDVSRWGRFQDVDESAYYEYMCRRCGVRVEYCMEQFQNDGSPMSAIMKGLKRIMAAEYSRELSQKVFLGKCRLASMGYNVGGIAVYGLRRMAIDPGGTRRTILQIGQQKHIATDRVVLVPGPAKEQRVIRYIFRQMADHGKGFEWIAESLNKQGILSPRGGTWSAFRVHYVLHNEKYIGNQIWAKTSLKLKTPIVQNPRDRWVRKDGAFRPIVDPRLYQRAHAVMNGWATRISDADALAALKSLLEKQGYLSRELINHTDGMPGSEFYANRFGGLHKAYERVGFKRNRTFGYLHGYGDRYRKAMAMRVEFIAKLRQRGARVENESRRVIVIDGRCRVTLALARYRPGRQATHWQVHDQARPNWTFVACENEGGNGIQSYWLIGGGKKWMQIGAAFHRRKPRLWAVAMDPLAEFLAGQARTESPRTQLQLVGVTELGSTSMPLGHTEVGEQA